MEIEELARELRARQTAIETIVLAMFAHLATHAEAPAHFIGQIMDEADRIVLVSGSERSGERARASVTVRLHFRGESRRFASRTDTNSPVALDQNYKRGVLTRSYRG
jgi:hypothetical protein